MHSQESSRCQARGRLYLMPTSPVSICRDCSSRALPGSSYCQAHTHDNAAAAYKRLYGRIQNEDPIRKLYQCKRWKEGTRLAVLHRDPLCCLCGHKASTVADHHPLTAREIVEQFGDAAFYDASRCQGLCSSCHSRKTATEDSTFANRSAS